MLACELPASLHVGVAERIQDLQLMLEVAVGDQPAIFNYFARVEGGTRTGKVLFREIIPEFPTVIPLHRPHNCLDAAKEFFHQDNMNRMRLFPLVPSNRHARKGWEVRTAQIWNQRVVVVWATWVD